MPPLCIYRLNWARRTSWGWWDCDMTMSSGHRIWNSSPGGLRPSTYLSVTEAPYNIESSRVSGEKTFCFFERPEPWRPEWGSDVRSPTFQVGSFNHCTRAPAPKQCNHSRKKIQACSVTTTPEPSPWLKYNLFIYPYISVNIDLIFVSIKIMTFYMSIFLGSRSFQLVPQRCVNPFFY